MLKNKFFTGSGHLNFDSQQTTETYVGNGLEIDNSYFNKRCHFNLRKST
jgi:hypothetical protein